MNLNKAIIVGRITQDPQLRQTPSGQSVTNFGVATNRVWTDKSGTKQEDTEFHDVVLWGRTAEVASQYLVKGQLVLVEGRLQTREWEGQDGNKRRRTEIIGDSMQMGPKPRGGGGGGSSSPNMPASNDAEEDIPTIDIDEDEEINPEDIPF